MEKVPFRSRKKYVLGDIDTTLRILDTEKRPYVSLHLFSEMYKEISSRDLQDDLRLSDLNLMSIMQHLEQNNCDNVALIPGDDYGITQTKFVFKRYQNADVNPNTQSDDIISFDDPTESLRRETVRESDDLGMPAIDLSEYGLAELAIQEIQQNDERIYFEQNDNCSLSSKDRDGEMQFFHLASGRIINYEKAFEQRRNIATKTVNKLKTIFRHSVWSNIENMCEVVESLRLLHRRYPNGCNAIQLCDFEEDLRKGTFDDELGKVRNIPAFSSLLDIGSQSFQMLVYVDGKYQVSADVLDVSFIRLRKNFCSNLYRLLHRLGGRARMCEIENSFASLTPRGIKIGVENVIELCNRYPLLFNLTSQDRLNCEVKSAVVELNKSFPDWLVRLDSESTVMEGSICSCAKCRSTLLNEAEPFQ